MTYERLSWQEFGTYLLKSLDLDPVYVALYRMDLSPGRLAAWLIAYFCFYHPGVACAMTESYNAGNYWQSMMDLVARPAGPRGSERRHFRGQAGIKAVMYLRERYASPLNALEDLSQAGTTFKEVSAAAQEWPLFGPWIAFKISDMLESCAGVPIDFSNCELDMYSEPTKGAFLIAELERWEALTVPEICDRLQVHFGSELAPPAFNRPVNIQEIETILCKFKSHYNGHYPLDKDTKEVLHMLKGWGDLAEEMERRASKPVTAIA